MFSWLLVRWIFRNILLVFRSLRHALFYLRKKLNIIEFPVYPVHHLFLRDFATEGDQMGHGAMNRASHRRARLKFYKESLAWERGNHSFNYAILLDIKNTGEAVRKAIEFNHPMKHLSLEGKGEYEHIGLLTKETRDIVISSVRSHQNGILLRAYEPMGRTIETELEFSFPVKRAYKLSCNSDDPIELKPELNRLRLVYEPYEMAMYQIEY